MKRTIIVVDYTEFPCDVPGDFSAEELADDWVRFRPPVASVFRLSFSEAVPVRMFVSRQASSAQETVPASDRPEKDLR